MLGWSTLMVCVLLAGAVILAALAKRLRDDVAEIEASLSALVALGPLGLELADEIARTRTRRTNHTHDHPQ